MQEIEKDSIFYEESGGGVEFSGGEALNQLEFLNALLAACKVQGKDIHLYPFYEKETKAGSLIRDAAKELLKCFWAKFKNQPAPPKVGITLQESATYTDFCNINIGGIKPDGSNGVNDVSYLLLEVVTEMRILQPSTNVQVSRKKVWKMPMAAAPAAPAAA